MKPTHIAIIIALSIFTGCQTPQKPEDQTTEVLQTSVPGELRLDNLSTKDMEQLGYRIASGDTDVINQLVSIREYIYSPESGYARERRQVEQNIFLIHTALQPVGFSAAEGNEVAMNALRQVSSRRKLRAFVDKPLGIAAKGGNEEAIDILLNHKIYDIIPGKAVRALAPLAETGNPKVIDFLIMASETPEYKVSGEKDIRAGLASAAYLGNTDAIKALKKMEENKTE